MTSYRGILNLKFDQQPLNTRRLTFYRMMLGNSVVFYPCKEANNTRGPDIERKQVIHIAGNHPHHLCSVAVDLTWLVGCIADSQTVLLIAGAASAASACWMTF